MKKNVISDDTYFLKTAPVKSATASKNRHKSRLLKKSGGSRSRKYYAIENYDDFTTIKDLTLEE